MHTDHNGMIGGKPLFGGDHPTRPANTIPNPSTRLLAHAQALDVPTPPGALSLAKAEQIVGEIDLLRGVQRELKAAFKDDELNGGWKAALEHPLWGWAEQRIAALHEEMKGLI